MESGTPAVYTGYAMNTEIGHLAYGEHAEEALCAANEELKRLEGLFSRYLPASDISRINKSAGIKAELISPDTFSLLCEAVHFSDICQGCFDITIGPLKDLWQKNAPGIPGDAKIRQATALVNHRDLQMLPSQRAAFLKRSGQSLDLGGVAKGYASERILQLLKKSGVTSACINLGGNVAVLGSKPDGSPFRVGIRHPRKSDRLIGAISVTDMAVVTSGDDQRYFIGPQGRRYHHILNPQTGYPAESGLLCVTVVSPNASLADALSTALFAAGMENGLCILQNCPNAQAVFVDLDFHAYVTPGLKDFFQPEHGIETTFLKAWEGSMPV